MLKFDELNIEIPFPHVTYTWGRGRTVSRPFFVSLRRTDECSIIMFAERIEKQQKDKEE